MIKYREKMRIAQAMKNNFIIRYLVYAIYDTINHIMKRKEKKKRRIKVDLISPLILRNLFQLQNFM